MNELYEFILSKDGVPMGNIRWYYDSDAEDNCRLAGDEAALAALQASMAQAVAEQWRSRYPHPSFVVVDNPLCSLHEMITVLQLDGYDMPEVLAPYTPEARNERTAKGNHRGRRY